MQSGDKPRLLFDSVLLGIVGGLGAQILMWMLRLSGHLFLVWFAGYRPPGLPEEGGVLREVIGPHGLWLVPIATTLGGLISGALVYGLAPETEGHGTDTVVKAVHYTGSVLRARVAPVKMLASAITIGSGGSAGREGPIALIAAGFGSVYASLLHRPEKERRLLVLMGMAAGLSAIFRSPIGTAIFAVEVLYGGMDFEADALIYCMLAAIVAYAVNGWFVGWRSLFQVPARVPATGLADYGWYVALGAASGVVATILPEVFYRMRDAFVALRVPAWIKPAVGGLGLGLLALRLPQVLGGGYGWIQEAIDGRLALHLLLVLLVAKMVAMSLTVSSGGSGGVFAPSLYVGAMLGGASQDFSPRFGGAGDRGDGCGFRRRGASPHCDLANGCGDDRRLPASVPAGLAVMLSYLIQVNLSSFFQVWELVRSPGGGKGRFAGAPS